MTLREAAERTSRSITTLRRYIRSGRLHAEKRYGRFGPEYFVAPADLIAAGLEPAPLDGPPPRDLAPASQRPAESPARTSTPAPTLPAPVLQDAVPTHLYQELQMKHEQLLVQYGMVRAEGLRVLRERGESDARRQRIEELESEVQRLRETSRDDAAPVRQELHQARLELQGRALEIDALREKVRTLEMLTRNSVTTDSIEEQYRDVVKRARRVQELTEQHAPRTVPSLDPRPPLDDH